MVQVTAEGRGRAGDRARRTVVEEIRRLTRVFDPFDPDSELSRVRAGTAEPGPELSEVLALAERWRDRTGGAFHPGVERLRALWAEAGEADREPDATEVDAVVASLVGPAPLASTNLNAIAKGWIVDRALDAAWGSRGLGALWVDAGGDIAHRGRRPITVGVEDPAQPHHNAPLLARLPLRGGAVATSGAAHRGWRIGDRWRSHVLDPRTGRPADGVASATVTAPDATTADVVATAVTVLGPTDGVALVESLVGDLGATECLVVAADGAVTTSIGWPGSPVR